jgi:glycosyltransferase involved in cell wall biosynthesis
VNRVHSQRFDIVFYINNVSFFIANFGNLVDDLRSHGMKVAIIIPRHDNSKALRGCGVEVIRMPFDRRKIDITNTVRSLWKGFVLATRQRSALHVSITIIPTVLFGIPNRLLVNRFVYFNTGMGTVYSSRKGIFRCLKPVVTLVFRILLSNSRSRLIVLNSDDRAFFLRRVGVRSGRVYLVHGCGTDENLFRYVVRKPEGAERVILVPARLIREKGIFEAVGASRILTNRGIKHQLWFSSDIDPGNPLSLTRGEVEKIRSENANVKFLGHVNDIIPIYEQAFIVCLPTYREGLPNAVIEAFAIGRPVVTSETTGCRDVVSDGLNGLLVPIKDRIRLADALARLLADDELYEELRARARADYERLYTKAAVLKEMKLVFNAARIAT